jgi:hypothetical protein
MSRNIDAAEDSEAGCHAFKFSLKLSFFRKGTLHFIP